jgi:hypothetical protein
MRSSEDLDRDLQGRRFGRGRGYSMAAMAAPSALASDLKLFALTFAGGFLFVTIFLA